MTRFARSALLITWVFVLVWVPVAARAQPAAASATSREVFGSVGFGHLANCCRTFGDGLLVGGGGGVRWRRLTVEADAQQMLGLSPRSLPCAVQYGQTCLPGRQGASSATLASVSALVALARTRIEPYAGGGVGVLWSKQTDPDIELQFSGVPNTPPIGVNLVQRDVNDTGFAINFGGGVRVAVTPAIGVRAEVRVYDATLKSAYNMGLVRVGVHVGYRW